MFRAVLVALVLTIVVCILGAFLIQQRWGADHLRRAIRSYGPWLALGVFLGTLILIYSCL